MPLTPDVVTTETVLYTANELMKIRIAGAMLAIGVLIIVYIAYKYFENRRINRAIDDAITEFETSGILYNPDEYQYVPFVINKKILYGFGILISVVGIFLIYLPA